MKKRLMSKLLMGALVVLTMGVFSSCKDYDDDINATNSRIDKVVKDLQDQVEALKAAQATCDNNFKVAKEAADAADKKAQAAQEAADKAQKAAEAADAKAQAAQTAADKAQAAAEAADAKAVAAQKAAEAADARAEAAEKNALAAVEKAKSEMLDKLADEAQKLQAQIDQKLSTEEFNKILATLATKEGLEAAIADYNKQIANLKTTLEAADKTLDEKIDAVTKALSDAIAMCVSQEKFDAAIAGLEARINAVDNSIALLQDEDKNLKDLIEANQKAIKENAGNIATNADAIAANLALIQGLQETVKQIEVNRAAIEELQKTSATKAELSAMEATLLAKIGEAQKALQDQITAINGTLEELKTGVTDNANAISQLQTAMQAAQDAITEINNVKFPELAQKIQDLVEGKADKTEVANLEAALRPLIEKNASDLVELFSRMAAVESEAAKIAGILTRLDDIDDEIDAIKAKNEGQDGRLNDLEAEASRLNSELVTLAGRVGQNEQDIAAIKQDITRINNDITAIKGRLDKVEKNLNVLTLFVNKNLTSIVTKPNTWIYGFPRVNATVIQAQPTYTFAYTAATPSKVAEDKVTTSSTREGYSFAVTANYWMNPTTFDKDNYTYAFEELPTTNTITRGNRDNQKAGTTIEETTYANGVLSVKFRFNKAENVNDAITLTDATTGEEYAWVTTMALRATRKVNVDETAAGLDKNRVITSDYAVFVPQYLNRLILGNSKYPAAATLHQEGNQKGHLNTGTTGYQKTVTEDAAGTYSFSVQRNRKIADGEITTYGDTSHGYLDLDNVVTVHYFDNGVEKIWTNAQARAEGFDFKYTMLDNANLFNQTDGNGDTKKGHKNIISLNDDGAKASNAGKALIIRVELVANNKTYAYGYVSLLITNTTAQASKKMGTLTLNCKNIAGTPENFALTYSWEDFCKMVADSAGTTVAIIKDATKYTIDMDGAAFKKYKDNTFTSVSTNKGTVAHVGTNLQWSFTLDDIKAAFYKTVNGKLVANTDAIPYVVWIRFQPTADGALQGLQEIAVKLTVDGVVYPAGSYTKDNRIQQMWFSLNGASIAPSADKRDEIHANVETLGQTLNFSGKQTAVADDEFVFDITSFFVANKFAITPATGFTFSTEADVFFDASKYWVKSAGGAGKDEHIYAGASGARYLLYLENAYSLELKAAPVSGASYDLSQSQVVVKLSGTHNEIATFMGYPRKADGSLDPDYAKYTFARDLLNHADHANLAAGATFVTHMIQHQENNCLPIIETGDAAFDIRYLRPVSAIANADYVVYDAQNTGNKIYLADLVNFIDWRDHKFAANWSAAQMRSNNTGINLVGSFTGMDYLNYYGVTTIKADFNKVKTNINGGDLSSKESWPNLFDITSKMQFKADAKAEAGAGSAVSPTRTYNDFRNDNGYYTYENNAGGVGDFYLYLPIEIVYDWGTTEAEWILIKVVKTQGQQNNARLR